jgi:hypothetical protein
VDRWIDRMAISLISTWIDGSIEWQYSWSPHGAWMIGSMDRSNYDKADRLCMDRCSESTDPSNYDIVDLRMEIRWIDRITTELVSTWIDWSDRMILIDASRSQIKFDPEMNVGAIINQIKLELRTSRSITNRIKLE